MAGFKDYKGTKFTPYILPIIPKGEPLAPESKLTPEKIGKIPGYKDEHGLWWGFKDFNRHTANHRILDAWARFYPPPLVETVGFRTVDYPVIDADITDE